MNKFCGKCGAPINADARFCSVCGAAIGAGESEAAAHATDDLPYVWWTGG